MEWQDERAGVTSSRVLHAVLMTLHATTVYLMLTVSDTNGSLVPATLCLSIWIRKETSSAIWGCRMISATLRNSESVVRFVHDLYIKRECDSPSTEVFSFCPLLLLAVVHSELERLA